MSEDIKHICGSLSEEEALELKAWCALSAALANAGNGAIANQGAVLAYNPFTTPAAGQYEVLLPDDSKLWLINASSLRSRPRLRRGSGSKAKRRGLF